MIIVPKSVKSALTKTGGFLYNYTHTLQPYTGCAFGGGCGVYCYVPSLPIHQYAGDVSTLRETLIDELIVVFWPVTMGTPK